MYPHSMGSCTTTKAYINPLINKAFIQLNVHSNWNDMTCSLFRRVYPDILSCPIWHGEMLLQSRWLRCQSHWFCLALYYRSMQIYPTKENRGVPSSASVRVGSLGFMASILRYAYFSSIVPFGIAAAQSQYPSARYRWAYFFAVTQQVPWNP